MILYPLHKTIGIYYLFSKRGQQILESVLKFGHSAYSMGLFVNAINIKDITIKKQMLLKVL